MSRELASATTLKLHGAVSRTKAALVLPTAPDVIGKHHPQHQALAALKEYAAQDEPLVRYKLLDAAVLLKYPGSWALFQLFEAIQLRNAWQLGLIDTLDDDGIANAFDRVSRPRDMLPFFPGGNVAPQLRLKLLAYGPLRPKIGYAVYLEEGSNGQHVAKLTHNEVEPFRILLPKGIHHNSERDVWETVP